MSQSLSAVYLHLIISTKNREPWLTDLAFREQVFSFIGGVSREMGCPPIIVGGVADHVHFLARFGRDLCQADWVKEIKRVSSVWIKKQQNGMAGFSWQAGYGIFSVSASSVEQVKAYIEGQEEHHQTMTFQEEYRRFLRKHGVEWDERYVWD